MSPVLRYLLMADHVPAEGGGGMVRVVVELARALADRDDVELHLTVAADGAGGRLDGLVPADRMHRRPGGPVGLRSVRERWTRWLRDLPPMDVVHGAKHLLPADAAGALRVLTVHDMLFLDRPGDFPAAKRLLLRRPYLASIRDADVLACVSAATRTRLLDYAPEVADRAVVVPLATPDTLRAVSPTPVAELAGATFALAVGDANPRKNLRLAVDTWPAVRAHRPDARLVLVGPRDWTAPDRGRHFDRLVAQGAVLHLGPVDDGTLRWCYEYAAAVLCPSAFEGFGLPVVEALRFGAPLVCSDDPAQAEAAGGAGRVVPVQDPHAWADAVVAALGTPRRVPEHGPGRSWAEAAGEIVDAVTRRNRVRTR